MDFLARPFPADHSQVSVPAGQTIQEAQTLADYLCLWMHGRRGRREAAHGRDTHGRFAASFRGHLLLARQVANLQEAVDKETQSDISGQAPGGRVRREQKPRFL